MNGTKGKGPVKVAPAPTWSNRRTKGVKEPEKVDNKGGRAVTPSQVQVDLVNRDPRLVNTHLKVHFEDVLGERGVRSPDCVWRTSWRCYTCWKNCLYKLSSLFCGVCLAVYYGCSFPVMAFPCIWFFKPFTVACGMFSHQCGRMWKACCMCFVGSWTEACGAFFWAFNPKTYGSVLPTNKRNVKFNSNVKTKVIPRANNQPIQKPGLKPTPRLANNKPVQNPTPRLANNKSTPNPTPRLANKGPAPAGTNLKQGKKA